MLGQSSKRNRKKNLDGQLPQSFERILPLDFVPPWRKDASNIEIRTSVPGIEQKLLDRKYSES